MAYKTCKGLWEKNENVVGGIMTEGQRQNSITGWFEALWLLIDIKLEKNRSAVLAWPASSVHVSESGSAQDGAGRRQLNVTLAAGHKVCVNETLSVTIGLNTHSHRN